VSKLREKLDELTHPPAGANAEWLDQQVVEIEQLKAMFPHSIELFQKATIEIANLNCYMYALGMSYEDIEYCVTCEEDLPSSTFVESLISSEILLQCSSDFSDTDDGAVVIYFNDETCLTPTHAGIKAGDKVISKWGWGGTHIWKHPPLEVPTQYGGYIKLYTPLTSVAAERAYTSWLHE
jgi:hypothetical protein